MPTLVDMKEEAQSWSSRRCRVGRPRKQDYVDLRERPSEHPSRDSLVDAQVDCADLIKRIQTAAASDPDDEGVDVIYEEIDSLLGSGAFEVVDDLLGTIKIESLSVLQILAFASITRTAPPPRVPRRSDFLVQARRRLMQIDPQRVEDLLAGIE